MTYLPRKVITKTTRQSFISSIISLSLTVWLFFYFFSLPLILFFLASELFRIESTNGLKWGSKTFLKPLNRIIVMKVSLVGFPLKLVPKFRPNRKVFSVLLTEWRENSLRLLLGTSGSANLIQNDKWFKSSKFSTVFWKAMSHRNKIDWNFFSPNRSSPKLAHEILTRFPIQGKDISFLSPYANDIKFCIKRWKLI